VRQLADSNGYVSLEQNFDLFGSLLNQSGDSFSQYGYAGEWTDATGLQYLRARYYAPSQGRFLTRDPFPGVMGMPATLHPYVYALNNPVLYTDPSEEVVCLPAILLIGAGIGGAASLGMYLVSTPSGCYDWEEAFIAFGAGAVAGFVGTGITMLVAALLPTMGYTWVAGAIAGGIGGGASAMTYNALTGYPIFSGIELGILFGTISGGLATHLTPARPGPTPNLSWSKGWPLRNTYVGVKSMDMVFEEIAQDTIGSFLAIIISSSGTQQRGSSEILPQELYWTPRK